MIKYRLRCSADHEFDTWFGSSTAFDTQVSRGLVVCPGCGTTDVAKALMAPSIATRRAPSSGPSDQARHAFAHDDAGRAELIEKLRELRRHLEGSADYVGPRFADEARKIHYEEADARNIWGEASAGEVSDLIEEGISILPVPRLPEEGN
ncbi:MAG: DUF1178 family protein [Hyphomicrobiaceae bacterium]|nr:DUF1178 family protein [Hyphomicrobiaceae bacterium]